MHLLSGVAPIDDKDINQIEAGQSWLQRAQRPEVRKRLPDRVEVDIVHSECLQLLERGDGFDCGVRSLRESEIAVCEAQLRQVGRVLSQSIKHSFRHRCVFQRNVAQGFWELLDSPVIIPPVFVAWPTNA